MQKVSQKLQDWHKVIPQEELKNLKICFLKQFIINLKQIFVFCYNFIIHLMNTSDMDTTKFDLVKITIGLSILSISILGISYLSKSEPIKASKSSDNNSVGLANLGNTCYMNSLLQALSGCPLYMGYIQNLALNHLTNGDDLLAEYILVLLQLQDNDNDVDPQNLYNLLCQDGEFTRMYEECDSHELNLFMQDKLVSLVSKSLRKSQKQEGLAMTPQDKISVLSDSECEPQEKMSMNPLLSMHQINIQCEHCSTDQQLHRHEFHLDINLDIPQQEGSNLDDLLRTYFQAEQLDDYNCIKCALKEYLGRYTEDFQTWKTDDPDFLAALKFFHKIYETPDVDEEEFKEKFKSFKEISGNTSTHSFDRKKVRIAKQKKILKPPKTLVIHFNRLAYDNTGHQYLNKNFVQFGCNLDLKPYCQFDFDVNYKLCSVIEHIGTPMFSHYISFKLVGEQWTLCNDHMVSQVDSQTVMKSKAYMLFYEKQ